MKPRFTRVLLGAALCASAHSLGAQVPDTDIYLATIMHRGERTVIGKPVNVTTRVGYDNQPWFLPDGHSFFFVAQHDGQTDVFEYRLRASSARRLTNTPESEYSPMLTPEGRAVTVVRVERDSSQHLWLFSRTGAPLRRAPGDVLAVGYYARADANTYALFLADSQRSLVLSNVRSPRVTTIATGLAGSAPQRIPGARAVSIVITDSARGRWIERLDLATRRRTPIVATRAGSPHYVWTRRGSILMAEGSSIAEFTPGRDSTWRVIATFSAPGLQRISRLALSPREDRIAIVSEGVPTPAP